MDAVTKFKNKKQNQNNKKRLVKFNKRRAIIASIVVVILLAGLGVGLYFALRKKLPSISAPKISVETALEKVSERDDRFGIMFESTDSSTSNSLIYGVDATDAYESDDIQSQKTAEGEFQNYLSSPQRDLDWYVVETKTSSDLEDDLKQFFINDATDSGASDFSGANYLGVLSTFPIPEYADAMQQAEINLFATNDEDNPLDVETNISSSDDSSEDGSTSLFDYPVLMWFDNGQLQYFTMGIGTDEGEVSMVPTAANLLDLETDDAFNQLSRKV